MDTFRRWQCETVYPNFEPPTVEGELSSGSAITVDNNSLLPKQGGAVETLPKRLGIIQRPTAPAGSATKAAPQEAAPQPTEMPATGTIDAEEIARLNVERYKMRAQRFSNAVDSVESATTKAHGPTTSAT